MTECALCESEVEAHDPVFVEHDGESLAFCNWACLDSYIDERELTTGACCRWEPTEPE